jgi:hypothetical protein
MNLFKKLFLVAATALLVACGGGGGGGTSAPALAVTVTGAGSSISAGAYSVISGANVKVTCNMSCVLTPSTNNASFTSSSQTASSWGADMVGKTTPGIVEVVASSPGQTSIKIAISVVPKLSETISGVKIINGTYYAPSNSIVKVTCDFACTLTSAATAGASVANVSITGTSWSGTLISPTGTGTVKITSIAYNQTNDIVINLTPQPTPLTTTEIITLTKSANTANLGIGATAAEAQYLFRMVSTSGKPPAGTGINQQFPALSSTGTEITSPCVTGSYKANWSIANNETVGNNDFVEITYTNCIKSDGAKFNGTSNLEMIIGASTTNYYGKLDFINFVKTTNLGTVVTIISSALDYSYANSTTSLSGVLTNKKQFGLSGRLTATVSATASNLQAGLKTYTSTNIFNSASY